MSTNLKTSITRILAIMVAMMLFFTVFSVLSTDKDSYVYGAGETGQVTASTLYVRSGAGTNYSKLGYLKKGKTFTITGTAKDKSGATWYKLKYNSKNGYVAAKYVNIKQASVTNVSDTKGTVATKKDPLTVRSGPGSSYSKIGTVAKGKTFNVTGKSTDKSGVVWYRLTYNGKTGYVSSLYVKTTSTSSGSSGGSSSTTPVTNTKGTVNTKSDPLTVRSGAGTKYSKLGTLAKGKTFDINGQAKDSAGTVWYQMVYNGKTGYVSSQYVKITQVSTGDGGDNNNTDNSGSSSAVTFQLGTVTTSSSPLNVRSGPGSTYSKLGTLSKGASVTITGSAKDKNGKIWYTYQFSSSKVGYICSDYVKVKEVTSDKDFETYMTSQGFPESYKPGLRALHAAHPNWVFKAVNVGCSWSTALNAETKNLGTNLVSSSSPVSYRSTAAGSYNSSTGAWTKFDGSWYAANSKVVAHYMDPRNFLDDNGIYQFMTHKYDGSTQNTNTVAAVVKGSFMETRNPGGGYSSYSALINDAGKATNVNPNVLAAMILQEQGSKGTSGLISGKYKGYEGYYNFFNINAYTTSSGSATVNGLKYASQSGNYGRPWNSVYKSIKGGSEFYSTSYVSKNQDTYYYKKFNVKNGTSKIGTHQYMTNVAGAASEGKLVKKAFTGNSNYAATFEIPVYTSMPSTPCPLP